MIFAQPNNNRYEIMPKTIQGRFKLLLLFMIMYC